MKAKHVLTLLLTALTLALVAGPALAGSFPSKDIRIIVPFKPGGAVDTTSRIIAEYAKKHLDGVELKVENRAGGGGVVGQTFAANAKPDGYTVLAMTSSVVTNPKLKQVSYQVSDFLPVALYTMDPEVIAVPAKSPYKTIEEFIAAARKAPLKVAEAGMGTSHHLSGLAMVDKGGVKLNFIHTKGFGAQLQALLGGHVDATLWPYGEAKSHADSGSIRILAVASDRPLESAPEIPTWDAAGLGIKEWTTFRGWAVPAGTPREAVEFLADLLGKVNQDSDYVERMKQQGYPLAYRDADGYAAVIANYNELTDLVISNNKLGNKK